MHLIDFLEKSMKETNDDQCLDKECLYCYQEHLEGLKKCCALSITEKLLFTKLSLVFVGFEKAMYGEREMNRSRHLQVLRQDLRSLAPKVFEILQRIYSENQNLNIT